MNPLLEAYNRKKKKAPPLTGGRERVFPTKHPMVENEDGSHSNVVIIGHSESDDGPVYAVPTMVGGKQLSARDAINLARDNGLQNYHSDPTPEAHNKWAGENHGNIGEDGFMKPKPKPSLMDAYNRKKRRSLLNQTVSPTPR